jgi:hypothetical protein
MAICGTIRAEVEAGRRIREEATMGDSPIETTAAARLVRANGEPVNG